MPQPYFILDNATKADEAPPCELQWVTISIYRNLAFLTVILKKTFHHQLFEKTYSVIKHSLNLKETEGEVVAIIDSLGAQPVEASVSQQVTQWTADVCEVIVV